jgi:hypothetical protein
MKIAILNLANNVTDFKTTPSGETIYFKKTLELLNWEVDIISNKKTQYTIPFEHVLDINQYEKLIVVNGAINFFGGKENPTIINNYKLMAQYQNTIYYFLTDLRLPFKQLWPSIEKRDWGYNKEEVYVTAPVKVISQTFNLYVVKQLMPDLECVYFPLERYKLLFEQNNNTTLKLVDINYGGSFRAGNREQKMIDYLFDTEYSVEFFGTAKLDQFKLPYKNPPSFTGKVNFNEVINKNNESYASIIIGDKLYNNNHITLRVWEVMMSNSIILIDNEFDPEHNIMGKDWFYINNKQDVKEKLIQIKQNQDYILKYQHNRIKELFNEQKYLLNLKEILI